MSPADEGDRVRGGTVDLSLDEAELLILNNALNEVCNGIDIDDFEFPARIGAEREEARTLLQRLRSLYEELAGRAG